MRKVVPKICGGDIELANFVLQQGSANDNTRLEAAKLLLAEIKGFPQYHPCKPNSPSSGTSSKTGFWRRSSSNSSNQSDFRRDIPQDWGRKFLAENGGCVYIDLDHLELCLPEVTSARQHLAAWFAMLQIAEDARDKANQKLPEGQKIHVLVNNSDGFGNSYGSHMNFLVTRECLENILYRRLGHMLYLMTYLVSSIIFTGQGKVGSENGSPSVPFQIAQRADFFETLQGIQTTYRRPIINTRDESHCYAKDPYSSDLARLHVIFFDSNLCHTAHFLKIGVTQLVLSMLEQDQISDSNILLKEPLTALKIWSQDPGLNAKASLISGGQRTALEVQMAIFDEVARFVASGKAKETVPDAQQILDLWLEVLCDLDDRNWPRLAPRLDWVLKFLFIHRVLEQDPDLLWTSPQIKHIDHLYSSLDRNEGLFWSAYNDGGIERLASEYEITMLRYKPPQDTRAYLRSHLLQTAGDDLIDMDWSWMLFNQEGSRYTVVLSHPQMGTSALSSSILESCKDTNDLFQKLKSLSPKQPSHKIETCAHGIEHSQKTGEK